MAFVRDAALFLHAGDYGDVKPGSFRVMAGAFFSAGFSTTR
jgi:hypothetical protein